MKDLFNEWYGDKIKSPSDRLMLQYCLDDIWNSKLIMPEMLGGDIFIKKSGYNDGPYGTNQMDTAIMKGYQAMNMWNKMETGSVPPDLNFDDMRIRTHGDNDAHSYPRDKLIYSWDPKFLEGVLGQGVKELVRDSNPCAHEYMGFQVKKVNDAVDYAYVGTRPFGKTVKSLCFRDKKYKDLDKERAYLAAIADCLMISDCWNDRSFLLIQEVRSRYTGERYPRTEEQKEKLYMLEKYGADNPRQTYWLESKEMIIEDTEEDVLNYQDTWD